MSQERRAALALHSANAGDREWVLKHLAGPQRDALQSMLGELAALGIPNEPDLNSAMPIESAPVKCGDFIAPTALTALERLRCASAQEMYEVLSLEPAGLVAQLTKCEPFSWAAACLSMFSAEQRVQISERLDGHAAPELAAALVEAIAGRLHSLHVQSSSSSSPPQLRRSTLPVTLARLAARWSAAWR